MDKKFKLVRLDDSVDYVIAQEKLKIGRSLDSDVVCPSLIVSRNHALISFYQDQPVIENRSTSILCLNSEKLEGSDKYPLYSGDIISLGTNQMIPDNTTKGCIFKFIQVENNETNAEKNLKRKLDGANEVPAVEINNDKNKMYQVSNSKKMKCHDNIIEHHIDNSKDLKVDLDSKSSGEKNDCANNKKNLNDEPSAKKIKLEKRGSKKSVDKKAKIHTTEENCGIAIVDTGINLDTVHKSTNDNVKSTKDNVKSTKDNGSLNKETKLDKKNVKIRKDDKQMRRKINNKATTEKVDHYIIPVQTNLNGNDESTLKENGGSADIKTKPDNEPSSKNVNSDNISKYATGTNSAEDNKIYEIDSEEEDFFCSQIFNTTDLDLIEDTNNKEKSENLLKVNDDVIVIDDDDDDDNNSCCSDDRVWLDKLSQSLLEEEFESSKDEENMSGSSKKKKKSISDNKTDKTDKPRLAILVDAEPLTISKKRNQKNKTDSKTVSDNEMKNKRNNEIRECRKQKLKEIADKRVSPKKPVVSPNKKPKRLAVKNVQSSRSDNFLDTLFENKQLKSNYIIPKNATKKVAKSPKRQLSVVLSREPFTEVNRITKVKFNDEPIYHYIEIIPGSKLLPCKKDLPLPSRSVIDDYYSNNVTVNLAPKYGIDESIYNTLRWRGIWLQETYRTKPPNVSNNKNGPKGVFPLRPEYGSFNDYFCIFQELLLHEVFAQILTDYLENARKMTCSLKIDSLDFRKLTSPFNKLAEQKQFLVVRCSKLLNETEFREKTYPKVFEYGLLTLQVFDKTKKKHKCVYCFCLVESADTTRMHPQELYSRRNMNTSNCRWLNLSLLLKPIDDYSIETHREIQLLTISFLKPFFRKFYAIINLPQSPLQQIILNPKNYDFQIPDIPMQVKILPSMVQLNPAQKEAVVNCTKLCLSNKPNIGLIHGPPGTGKSRVIVSLVESIFHTSKQKANRLKDKPKLLICAPSNLAVDLLVERLLDLREKMIQNSKTKLSIIRIGQIDEKNPKVASIGIDKLARNRLEAELCDDIPIELSLINAKINSLKYITECNETDNDGQQNVVNEKLAELVSKKSELENITPEDYDKKRHFFDQAQIRMAQKNILRGADVVVSTLSSSVLDYMDTAFNSGVEKEPRLTCCIVDEAAQCCEPDVLIPLKLKIDKMILVGDHKQLPATVLSELSKSKGLGNSLFYRIFKCWESLKKPNLCSPIYQLDVQYRMHPSIMHWPAKYFYNGLLKTGYDHKKYNFPLASYTVINHNLTEHSENKEINYHEADMVIDLLMKLAKAPKCQDLTIGVITPYRKQQRVLNDKFFKRCNEYELRARVKINTIDGFQGAERDIVIISCVRSSGPGFFADEQRLNVAVTRARHCLIICVNTEGFKNNNHWNSLIENSKTRKKYLSLRELGNLRRITSTIILK